MSNNILKKEYPGNSLSQKDKQKETSEVKEKKVVKVVKGGVVKRKKSFGKRIVETFVGEDIDNVGQYIIHDVLVPATKNMLSDMVQGGIEMMLFGERKGSRTKRDGNRSYVSYGNYYSDKKDGRREVSRTSKARHNFDDIVLSSRGEAEEVLSSLVDLVEDYQEASVADLYDLVGVASDFTDNKWGWTNLRSASVVRARDGYQLNLPRPIQLD